LIGLRGAQFRNEAEPKGQPKSDLSHLSGPSSLSHCLCFSTLWIALRDTLYSFAKMPEDRPCERMWPSGPRRALAAFPSAFLGLFPGCLHFCAAMGEHNPNTLRVAKAAIGG
jgi:hypothetical protein